MERGARSLIALSLILVALLPAGAGASSPGIPSAGPYVKLGYGPTSLTAVTRGTPVYTVGDELWFMSDYNQSVYVNVVPPDGSSPAVSQPVPPHAAVRLYVFGASDSPGDWVLGVRVTNSSFGSVRFGFEKVPVLAAPSVVESSVEPNGTLAASLRASLGNESAAQGCVIGSDAPAVVQVPYPRSLGSGNVALAYAGGTMRISNAAGAASQTGTAFDFWVELYYTYSYISPSNPRQLITGQVLAAGTPTVSLGGRTQTNQSSALARYVQLRTGRYDLRAFFRYAGGLSVYETTVVMQGGNPWVWLGGCLDLADMATTFAIASPLSGAPPSWPRGIYSMADVLGVEGFSYTPLPLNLSRISLVAAPWGGRVPGGILVRIFASSAGSSCVDYNSTVYCDLSRVPSTLTLTLGYAGMAAENSSLPIGSRFYAGSIDVPLGKLVLNVTAGGAPVSSASVTVNAGRAVEKGITGQDGTATFLLLGGNYSVGFRYGAYNTTVAVRVTPGSASVVDVSVPQAISDAYVYLLLALGAVGVAFDVWAWKGVARKKG
ncbi:MAG TPA: carboxypeptidase-like regulatory domain-containing protein [Nitrososphaerales archaeon]|nr:carboxypeptidase-like regulatory domain-containing protein [Nitrososphaerales archaeon]